MDLFSYDHEELARRVQTGLDRMTVNYLRAHGARVRRDDLDFHGMEHIDLEVEADGHRLVVRQSSPSPARESQGLTLAPGALTSFESTFDGRPAAEVSVGLLAQWLALLPEGEAREERAQAEVDPSNPFLAEKKAREEQAAPNPFLTERPATTSGRNPFAPDARDEKRRAALNWLAGDDEEGR